MTRSKAPRNISVATAATLVALVVMTGCAYLRPAVTTERLPNGTIHLTCKSSLAACLVHAEEACRGTRYKVLGAVDQHDYMGAQSTVGEMESRAAEAIVQCGSRGKAMFGGVDSALPPLAGSCGPDAAKDAAKTAASSACVAGTTQECLGPGACRGAQACLPDRSGYAACDCGSAPVAAPSTTPATADGGTAAPAPTPR